MIQDITTFRLVIMEINGNKCVDCNKRLVSERMEKE
jgi:hypothetical protein